MRQESKQKLLWGQVIQKVLDLVSVLIAGILFTMISMLLILGGSLGAFLGIKEFVENENSGATPFVSVIYLSITAGIFVVATIAVPIFTYEYVIESKSSINSLFFIKPRVYTSYKSKILRITALLYSSKTQKEVFEPIAADWQEEYFEALFKKESWKACWINVRYTYAFLVAMWQKSPIGDLIEFISKLAK